MIKKEPCAVRVGYVVSRKLLVLLILLCVIFAGVVGWLALFSVEMFFIWWEKVFYVVGFGVCFLITMGVHLFTPLPLFILLSPVIWFWGKVPKWLERVRAW